MGSQGEMGPHHKRPDVLKFWCFKCQEYNSPGHFLIQTFIFYASDFLYNSPPKFDVLLYFLILKIRIFFKKIF